MPRFFAAALRPPAHRIPMAVQIADAVIAAGLSLALGWIAGAASLTLGLDLTALLPDLHW